MRRRAWLIALVMAVPALFPVQVARACSIDGIVSISVDGVPASLTGDAPSTANAATWAPFTLVARAPNSVVHLGEDLDKIRRSLPAGAFATPFRWTFGDGSGASGSVVAHRYARLGWYRVTVRYYWAARHAWLLFDNARIQIVTSGGLWRANLGYNLTRAIERAGSVFGWILAIGLLALALWPRHGLSR